MSSTPPEELVRAARLGAGLTQAHLAQRLGTTQSAVARLERRGSNPRIDTIARALEACGRRLDLRSRGQGGVPVASWPEFSALGLLRALTSHGVDFVVIGGIAMVFHGSTRVTQDLDVCVAPDQTNLDVLGHALIALGARLRGIEGDVPFSPDGRALRGLSVTTLDTTQGPIDLLREPAGAPPYEALRRRSERIEVDGMAVLVASLDDLAAMKRAAGRRKDELDLEEIEVIRRLRSR